MVKTKSFWTKSAKDFTSGDWALLLAMMGGVVLLSPMLAKLIPRSQTPTVAPLP